MKEMENESKTNGITKRFLGQKDVGDYQSKKERRLIGISDMFQIIRSFIVMPELSNKKKCSPYLEIYHQNLPCSKKLNLTMVFNIFYQI